MRKFVSFLPLIVSIFGAIYGAFDPRVWAYIQAHPLIWQLGGVFFVASESLAATDWVKSNSIAQAIFDVVLAISKTVFHK